MGRGNMLYRRICECENQLILSFSLIEICLVRNMAGVVGLHTMRWKAAEQLRVRVVARPAEAIGCHDLHAAAREIRGSAGPKPDLLQWQREHSLQSR
jgi:hypothetical protein